MKAFNKNKALRKINLQQNKNTYIKRLSISLSCLILLFVVILFTFARFEVSSDEYVLINGLVKYNVCEYEIGQEWTFGYTGSSQEFNVPCNGEYKVELWGAQGGDLDSTVGGLGGFTSGYIDLRRGSIYVYTGGQGSLTAGGYNGGAGPGGTTDGSYSAGGGATDVRLVDGEWNNFDSLKSRIMVAAGGAGSGMYKNGISGGAAGGLIGYGGTYSVFKDPQSHTLATGASQTSPGLSINNGTPVSGFGFADRREIYGTGGGSGYYGGGSGGSSYCFVSGGAGGSSFISGYNGCNAVAESSTQNNIVHTNQPNHYSGKVFTNSVMIDGKGCNWSSGTAANCGANQVQPNGANAAGHSGNGYAKITLISTTDIIRISNN